MKIYVKNMVPMSSYKGIETLEVDDSTKLKSVIERYDLEPFFQLVNNSYQDEDYVLCEGDVVSFLPEPTGG